MSYITDVILLMGGLIDYEEQRPYLDRINEWLTNGGERSRHARGLVSAQSPELPEYWPGGSKAFRAGMAVGAFNYLDEEGFLSLLRSIPWNPDECFFVQVVMRSEHDDGFALHNVFDKYKMKRQNYPETPEAFTQGQDEEQAGYGV